MSLSCHFELLHLPTVRNIIHNFQGNKRFVSFRPTGQYTVYSFQIVSSSLFPACPWLTAPFDFTCTQESQLDLRLSQLSVVQGYRPPALTSSSCSGHADRLYSRWKASPVEASFIVMFVCQGFMVCQLHQKLREGRSCHGFRIFVPCQYVVCRLYQLWK
jgi:hypothetical protein